MAVKKKEKAPPKQVGTGPEWEAAAKMLVDRRRSRVGPPDESLSRWRGKCDIVELVPNVATLETTTA